MIFLSGRLTRRVRSACGACAVVTSMPPSNSARSVAVSSRPAWPELRPARVGIEFLKGSGLKSLVPYDQSVRLPEEDLYPIAAAVEEQEQMPRERVLPQKLATMPRRPSKLFRISVACVQRKTRTAAGS